MQAIITKYLPATNTKPSRIKAECERGSIIVSYEDSMTTEQAHISAAKALIRKFMAEDVKQFGPSAVLAGSGWNCNFVTGGLPSGDYCHVFQANARSYSRVDPSI